jgi:hypothetical protein
LAAQSAFAGAISWGTPQQIAGDSDVQTGSVVYAYALGWGGSTTINGVMFAGFAPNSSSGNLAVDGMGGAVGGASDNTFASPDAPFASLSSAYQSMLGNSLYDTGSTTMGITLGGLTIGQAYEVEVWVNDSRGSVGPYRWEDLTTTGGVNSANLDYDTGGEGGLGEYVIGTFTADATTQAFDAVGYYNPADVGGAAPQIDGIELLNAAPEPASVALVGAGVLAVAFLKSRRFRRARG